MDIIIHQSDLSEFSLDHRSLNFTISYSGYTSLSMFIFEFHQLITLIVDFYIITFIISGVLSTTLGSIVINGTTKIFRQAIRSKVWSSTSGRISDVEVIKKDMYKSSKKKMFETNVKYQYSVEGTIFTGNQQNIGNLNTSYRSKAKAEQLANKFTEGQEVIIYYNSSKPENSSLSVGVGRYHIRDFLFGFIFLILGIALIGLGIILLNH